MRFILLGLISLIIIFVQYTVSQNDRAIYWRGWYLLEVTEPVNEIDVATHLRENGVHDFLGASNATIPYMTIPRLERKTVDFLERTLSPEDPRRDSFIARVGSLFTVGGNTLIFLPSTRSLGFYSDIIGRHEMPNSWNLYDKKKWAVILFQIGIYILFVSMAILFVSRKFNIVLSLLPQILPWALFILFSHTSSPYIGVVFHILTLEKFEHRKRGLLFFRIMSIPGIMLLQFYLCIPAERLDLFLAFSASILIMFARHILISGSVQVVQMNSFPTSGKEHELFAPVQLVSVSDRKSGNVPINSSVQIPRIWLIIMIILLMVLTLFSPHPGLSPHNVVPAAGKPLINFDDWSGFPQFLSNPRGVFPHFVDLLMSRSYQEGFIYGATYRMPKMDESLFLDRYVDAGDTIKVVRDTLIKYDDQWFGQLLEDELQSGVGLLYASLGGVALINAVNLPPGTISREGTYSCNILALFVAVVYQFMFLFFGRSNFQGVHRHQGGSSHNKYLPGKISSRRVAG